jgi:maltose alpha-D-glucosyltransferase/alpha-amylase
VLAAEAGIYRRFEGVRGRRLAASRTRRHGDYQLHSVLWTGRDFVVVDFDGKSGRPLAERRRKRSPLRDVAGMVRSLSQCAFAVLNDPTVVREADRALARPWAWLWHAHAAAAFLRGYFRRCGDAPFLPRDPRDAALLLDAFVLEKALKDVADALERQPAGAPATLEALLRLLQ